MTSWLDQSEHDVRMIERDRDLPPDELYGADADDSDPPFDEEEK